MSFKEINKKECLGVFIDECGQFVFVLGKTGQLSITYRLR